MEATYLAWLDCSSACVSIGNPSEFFLEKARVAISDGEEFGKGGENHVRLSFACPRKTLDKAPNRMKNALEIL
jgi:cystathionine beta-lyase